MTEITVKEINDRLSSLVVAMLAMIEAAEVEP